MAERFDMSIDTFGTVTFPLVGVALALFLRYYLLKDGDDLLNWLTDSSALSFLTHSKLLSVLVLKTGLASTRKKPVDHFPIRLRRRHVCRGTGHLQGAKISLFPGGTRPSPAFHCCSNWLARRFETVVRYTVPHIATRIAPIPLKIKSTILSSNPC